MILKIKLDEGAFMPVRAHASDAGMDIRTPYDVNVYAEQSVTVSTGVHMEIPHGYVGIVKAKSGLSVKYGIETGAGVVDSGYTGEINVKLLNLSERLHTFRKGDKIAQILIVPVELPALVQVDDLEETERGDNGFGSTGR